MSQALMELEVEDGTQVMVRRYTVSRRSVFSLLEKKLENFIPDGGKTCYISSEGKGRGIKRTYEDGRWRRENTLGNRSVIVVIAGLKLEQAAGFALAVAHLWLGTPLVPFTTLTMFHLAVLRLAILWLVFYEAGNK